MTYSPDEEALLEILEYSAERPGLVLGARSFQRLCGFIDGFIFARRGIEAGTLPVMSRFEAWMREFAGLPDDPSWERIIRFYSVDDSGAYDSFFRRWSAFLKDDRNSRPQDGPPEVPPNP